VVLETVHVGPAVVKLVPLKDFTK
jgi:hypothetical protein